MAPILRTEPGQIIARLGLSTTGMLVGMGGMAAMSFAEDEPDSKLHTVGTAAAVLGGVAAVAGAALLAKGALFKVSNTRAYDAVLGAHELKPFHIQRKDVDSFLRGSVVPHPYFHTSSEGTRASILRDGVDVTRSTLGVFGRGFYTASRPDHTWGDVGVAVVVKAERPFDAGGSASTFQARVEDLARLRGRPVPDGEAAIRETLLEAGFDSILIKRPLTANWLVGLDSSKVRVVVADIPGGAATSSA